MGHDRAHKLSLGQVAHLRLLSVGLIILIIFYMSKADARVSSSTLSADGGDQYEENSYGLATNSSRASREITNYGQPRIDGYNFAHKGEFPFHVGVYSNGILICGGVLIDDYRILTTKACSRFNIKGMQVALGDFNRTKEDGEFILGLRRIERHPRANLAILFVDPVTFDREPPTGPRLFFPIWLPLESQYVQGKLLVTGWGSNYYEGPFSKILKKAVITVADCRWPKSGIFCSQQTRVGPCSGDTGGAVFQPNRGDGFTLVGLIAGANCKQVCDNPSCDHEYVDILPHLEWINDTH